MKKVLVSLLLLVPGLLLAQTGWVNPFIGTEGAHSPGAVTPNALVSVSPFKVDGGAALAGFGHINLRGADSGALLTMPTSGSIQVDYPSYGCEFSDEKAAPGYYGCTLSNGVRVEATSTTRTSIERYTFPEGPANILLNLGDGSIGGAGAMIRRVSETEVEGFQLLSGVQPSYGGLCPVYFVLRISKAPTTEGYWRKQRPVTASAPVKYLLYDSYDGDISGDEIGYRFSFESIAPGEQITLQMGVSLVSIDGARENLDAEQKGFDFEKVRAKADAAWNVYLAQVQVEGGTVDQKTVFYTALYHTLIHPCIISDVSGKYPLAGQGRIKGQRIGTATEGERYQGFPATDECLIPYRLVSLLYPSKQQDMELSLTPADGSGDVSALTEPYLFSRTKGEEWRTWKAVHFTLEKDYRNAPDGLPRDDWSGALSAWAAFSMMGFYPDSPSEPYFTLTVPAFDKVSIGLPGGNSLEITKDAAADFALQAQSQAMSRACSAKIGGKKVKSYRISTGELLGAGKIVWK